MCWSPLSPPLARNLSTAAARPAKPHPALSPHGSHWQSCSTDLPRGAKGEGQPLRFCRSGLFPRYTRTVRAGVIWGQEGAHGRSQELRGWRLGGGAGDPATAAAPGLRSSVRLAALPKGFGAPCRAVAVQLLGLRLILVGVKIIGVEVTSSRFRCMGDTVEYSHWQAYYYRALHHCHYSQILIISSVFTIRRSERCYSITVQYS